MIMYKIKMNKITSSHENFRAEIIGVAPELPKINKNFVIVGEPLEDMSANVRTVITSPIKNIDKKSSQEWIVTTLNSTYKVEFLEDEEE